MRHGVAQLVPLVGVLLTTCARLETAPASGEPTSRPPATSSVPASEPAPPSAPSAPGGSGGSPESADTEPVFKEGSCNLLPTLAEAAGEWVYMFGAPEALEPFDDAERWVGEQIAKWPSPQHGRKLAARPTRRVLEALRAHDYAALARLTDNVRGLCVRASFSHGCKWISPAELERCATSTKKSYYNVDDAAEGPDAGLFTCREAMDDVFFRKAYLGPRAKLAYNCFPAHQTRSNCGGGYIERGLGGDLYVEVHLPDERNPEDGLGWRSLWLTFQTVGDRVVLLGMMAEYWGI